MPSHPTGLESKSLWLAVSIFLLSLIACSLFATFIYKLNSGVTIGLWRCADGINAKCLEDVWTGVAKDKPVHAPPFVKGNGPPPVAEIYARQVWGMQFFAAIISTLIAVGYACYVMHRTSFHYFISTLTMWFVITIFGMFNKNDISKYASPVLDFIINELFPLISNKHDGQNINIAYDLIMWIYIPPLFAGMILIPGAMSATLLRRVAAPGERAVTAIGQRVNHLRRLLYLTSVVFVLSVIAASSFCHWPTHLLPPDSLLAKDMTLLGKAALVHWGGMMSLLLLFAYGGPALLLQAELETLRQQKDDEVHQAEPPVPPIDVRAVIGRLVLVMLPLLAGSIDPLSTLPQIFGS